jgi:hypothetical protein
VHKALLATLIVLPIMAAAPFLFMPMRSRRQSPADARLNGFVPHYQFSEFHKIHIAAKPAAVYAAMRNVTAEDIRGFRTLTWIRRVGCDGEPSILNPPRGEPIISVATRTGFELLADDKDRELVVGTWVIDKRAFAAINFRITPAATGSVITTETRVYAGDAAARRRFAMYWRLIHPGSAVIRRNWLRAIRARAEV